MPRVRQGLVVPHDGEGYAPGPHPTFVDVQTRPKKKRKSKGLNDATSGGSNGLTGGAHNTHPAKDTDEEMRWGAELVLQLALGGDAVPTPPKLAVPPGGGRVSSSLGNKGKRKQPTQGTSSAPLSLGTAHVLVGDPVVRHPARAAVSDGAVPDPVSHFPTPHVHGTTLGETTFLREASHVSKAPAVVKSDAVASRRPPSFQNTLPPLRLAARAALPKELIDKPPRDVPNVTEKPRVIDSLNIQLPTGNGDSLCDLLLAARDDESRELNVPGTHMNLATPRSAGNTSGQIAGRNPSESNYPNLVDQFTKVRVGAFPNPTTVFPYETDTFFYFSQAFRTLQATAAALVKAHADSATGTGGNVDGGFDADASPLAATARWTAATANAMALLESEAAAAAAAAADGSKRVLSSAELDLIGLVGLVGRAVGQAETPVARQGSRTAQNPPGFSAPVVTVPATGASFLRRPVSSQTVSAGPKPPPSQMLLNLSNAAFVRANKTGVAKEDIVNFVHRGTVTVGTGGTLSAPGNTPSPTTPPSAKFPEFAPVDRSREGYVQKARDGSQDVSADGHPSPVSPFKKARSSSTFRGVTLHRRTKRWESHIWVRYGTFPPHA